MNIKEFTALAAEKVERYLREEMQANVIVRTEEVRKINDQCLHGVRIEQEGALEKGDAVPTYYMEELYQAYLHDVDLDFLIGELAKAYMNTLRCGPLPAEVVPDMEYRTIRRRVGLRLVGKDYNREFLKTVPYKDVGNGYALLCDVQLKASDGGIFSTLVTNEMAEDYHYDMDALFKEALDNAWKSKAATLQGAGELGARSASEKTAGPYAQETCYVLTTDRPRFGAAALFYPGTQAMIAHVLQEDYIAIPSSLHEFMIVRASCVGNPGDLYQFLREANRTIVSPDEVLSDKILKYSRSTGTLSVLPGEDMFTGLEEDMMLELQGQTWDAPARAGQS